MIEVPCYNCGSMDHAPYASENGYASEVCLLWIALRESAARR
jgi:hypothetical protein